MTNEELVMKLLETIYLSDLVEDDVKAVLAFADEIRRECVTFEDIKDWLIGKSSEYKSEYIQSAIVMLRVMFEERSAILGKESCKTCGRQCPNDCPMDKEAEGE